MSDLLVLAFVLLLVVLLLQGRIPAIKLFAKWELVYVLVDWVPQPSVLAGYVKSTLVTLMLLQLVSVDLECLFLIQRLSKMANSGSDGLRSFCSRASPLPYLAC